MIKLLLSFVVFSLPVFAQDSVKIAQGYVYKFRCEGRLLVSAVGDERLVRLEALPREIGCGAIVKSVSGLGITNIIFETTQGSFSRVIQITSHSQIPKSTDVLIGGSK